MSARGKRQPESCAKTRTCYRRSCGAPQNPTASLPPPARATDREVLQQMSRRDSITLMALSPRMQVLSAIAKTGSLSAAGRQVGLTQQGVSARLTSIEAQTGVRLVTRTTRGSQLTQAGEVVAEWADQMLEVAQRV